MYDARERAVRAVRAEMLRKIGGRSFLISSSLLYGTSTVGLGYRYTRYLVTHTGMLQYNTSRLPVKKPDQLAMVN
jgi:hypothetical protein